MTAAVSCPDCAREYRWKPEFAGKRGKCKCGGRVSFPEEDPAVSRVAEDDAWLDPPAAGGIDVVAEARSSTLVDDDPLATTSSTCPHCHAAVKPTAAMCVGCGTDLKSGKRLNTKVKHAPSGVTGALGEGSAAAAKGLGFLAAASIGGLVAALVGGGVWAGIAAAIDMEIGWIAWGVGLLAGFGTVVGARGHRGLGVGLLAAFFGFLGVVAGKAMIAMFVVVPVLEAEMPDIPREDQPRIVVLNQLAWEEGGLTEEEQVHYDRWLQAEDEWALPQPLRDAADDALAAMTAQERAQIDSDVATMGSFAEGFLLGIAFIASFSLWDFVFIPLAVFSAFGIGSGISGGGD